MSRTPHCMLVNESSPSCASRYRMAQDSLEQHAPWIHQTDQKKVSAL
jgi:hypothetical protein